MTFPTTVLLVRHARSTANSAGVLAGRAEGVGLDETGLRQAARLGERLADVPVDRLVSSPAERCLRTLEPLASALGLPIETDDRLSEVDYGEWTGRALKDLAGEPLWRVVQHHPAAAAFPAGESLAAVSARAVAAIRDLVRAAAAADTARERRAVEGGADARHGDETDSDESEKDESEKDESEKDENDKDEREKDEIEQEQPRAPTILVCSHGDVIKAVLADALGLHLDSFQRIVVAPVSISVVRYTPLRPFVDRINDTGDLDALRPLAAQSAALPAAHRAAPDTAARPAQIGESDAVPGGVVT
jgi:probable phosphomutase (TIGR03848 family)